MLLELKLMLLRKTQLNKTRNYRDEAAARYSNAEASQKINEVLANVQTKSNSIQIDSIERKIQKKESLANGLGELREVDTFDSEFEALDAVDLDLELEKYKNNNQVLICLIQLNL